MRGDNNSYRTYLENQELAELPRNRNQKSKSEYLKDTNYQRGNIDDGELNNGEGFKNSAKPNRYKTQQQQQKLIKSPHKNSFATIPYNTQEINRNVNKVLSDIEEIESEFRKLSSQNSIHIRAARYENQSNYQSIVTNNTNVSGKFLEELMDKIKRRINYEQKTDDFISKQKAQLVKLLKNLNQKLNNRLKEVEKDQRKSIIRSTIAETKLSPRRRIKTDYLSESQKKNQSIQTLGKSIIQVDEQFNNNQKLIQNMKNQLDFLNKKYEGYQRSLKNYKSTQHSVDQLQQIIKRKKQQISKLRRKKFLRQKAIISVQKKKGSIFTLNSTDISSTNCSTSTHTGDILSSLKQQYRQYLKKKQKLKSKLQINKMHLNRIQQLKDKNNVNKQHYDELMDELRRVNGVREEEGIQVDDYDMVDGENDDVEYRKLGLSRSNNKKHFLTQTQQQHLEFIYKTKRTKLQMLMNTVKRNDQIYKRRYYTLLKQYEAMIDQQSHNNNDVVITQSPKALSNGSHLYKAQQQQIVEGKLGKSRVNIVDLENRISRLGKVGKIIKKVNHAVEKQQYQDQQYEIYSQEEQQMAEHHQSEHQEGVNRNRYDVKDDNESNNHRLIKRNASNSKSQTTPLVKDRHALYVNVNNNGRNKRIISTSTYLKTPQSEVSQKESYEKDTSFMTQNIKSLQDLGLALQNSRLNKTNQQKKKYIGKFKKQKIIQKQSKRANDFVGMSDILLGKKTDNNNNSKSIIDSDNNTNSNNNTTSNNTKATTPNKKTIILDDIHQPIIQQQIQATNSLSSSQYKPKRPSSPKQTDWDQKILNLIRHNQDIQEEIESEEDGENNERKEQENYDDEQEEGGFSPQKESEMLLLRREENRAEKEYSIKQKYQQILFKSKLFS